MFCHLSFIPESEDYVFCLVLVLPKDMARSDRHAEVNMAAKMMVWPIWQAIWWHGQYGSVYSFTSHVIAYCVKCLAKQGLKHSHSNSDMLLSFRSQPCNVNDGVLYIPGGSSPESSTQNLHIELCPHPFFFFFFFFYFVHGLSTLLISSCEA